MVNDKELGVSLSLGDPPEGRRALDRHQPWQPTYDDMPIKSGEGKRGPGPMTEQHIAPKPAVRHHAQDYLGPPAEVIAVAMVMSCSAFGLKASKAEDMANGEAYGDISRARMYAAWALRTVCPEWLPKPQIARKLGVSVASSAAYVANLEFRMRTNNLRWWEPALADRVIDAVRECRDALLADGSLHQGPPPHQE